MKEQRHVPALVVGAGPVGLSCALFLRSVGVPVAILEKAPVLSMDMRASTFHPPTLDMLATGRISETLVRQGTVVPRWQYRQHETGERIVFDLGCVSAWTRHPFRLQCEQWRLTHAIAQALQVDRDASIEMGAEVTALESRSDSVVVEYQVDGRSRRVRADFVVAADGASSTIRGLTGAAFEGDTYPTRAITIVVDCAFEDYVADLLPVNYCWTADDRFSLMRVGPHWRTGYSPRPGQPVEDALSDEYVNSHVRRVAGRDLPYQLVHRAVYSVHRRLLASFRCGRILFAGDAAHLNSPSGGMGMNSGIHDAYVLSRALAAVIGGAPESRLEDYAAQRRTIAAQDVQRSSDRHHRLHRERDEARRRANWERLSQIAADPASATEYLRKSSMLEPLVRCGVAPVPVGTRPGAFPE